MLNRRSGLPPGHEASGSGFLSGSEVLDEIAGSHFLSRLESTFVLNLADLRSKLFT